MARVSFRPSSGGGDRLAADLYEKMGGGKRADGSPAASPKGGGRISRPPNFLTCYLCGQQFGKASLPIHQPQCYVKKLLQWERGDPATRGSKPLHPDEMAARQEQAMAEAPVSGGGRQCQRAVDAFNEQQYKAFEEQMVACENCGRTFFPDRLVVHQRSCFPGASGRGSKPVRKGYAGSPPPARASSPARTASPARKPVSSPSSSASPANSPGHDTPPARTRPSPASSPNPAAAPPADLPPGHPRFCQECGAQFTRPCKFCMECGTKVEF